MDAGVEPDLFPRGSIEREVVVAVAGLLAEGKATWTLVEIRDRISGRDVYPFEHLSVNLSDLDAAYAVSEDFPAVVESLIGLQDSRRVSRDLFAAASRLESGDIDADGVLEELLRLRDRSHLRRGELPDVDGYEAWCAAESAPPFILGPLRRGQLALLSGPAGTGKSWDALAIAHGVTTGQPVYGAISTTRARVGVVLTETPRWELRSRLVSMARANEWPSDDDGVPSWLHDLAGVLTSEDGRFHDITQSPPRRRLIRWVVRNGMELLILDPLTHLFPGGNDADPVDLARLISALEELHAETGVTMLIMHHDRKAPPGAGRARPDRALDRARGGTRLTAFFDAVFSSRPEPADDGLRQLQLGSDGGKVRSGKALRPIYLRANVDGVPIPVDAPIQAGTTSGRKARREAIVSVVSGRCVADDAPGVSLVEILASVERSGFEISRRQMREDLDDLVESGLLTVRPGAGTRPARYLPRGRT
jgi:hypothetical protein